MKFGIFYELPAPATLGRGQPSIELVQNALDQIELADKLGFDYAWEVEHHFLEEYSHSSAPEVFLAAASQRTKNIRLGHGIVQLTTNHPARVAERVVDARPREQRAASRWASAKRARSPSCTRSIAASATSASVWEDAVKCVLPMFSRGGLGVPRRVVRLPAAQRRAEAAAEAASAAVGRVLASSTRSRWRARAAWARSASSSCRPKPRTRGCNAYYNAYTKHLEKLCDYQTNPNIAVVSGFMCSPTPTRRRSAAPRAGRSSSSRWSSTTRTARSSRAP